MEKDSKSVTIGSKKKFLRDHLFPLSKRFQDRLLVEKEIGRVWDFPPQEFCALQLLLSNQR